VNGVIVQADLFHVTTKTVKEQMHRLFIATATPTDIRESRFTGIETTCRPDFPDYRDRTNTSFLSAHKNQMPLVSDETTVTGEKRPNFR